MVRCHYNDDHAFTRALTRFEELVQKYYGKPVNFTLHKNSSLGLEKQYFEYMSQGKAVDYGIVSPAHMSTFAKAAFLIDAPFVFKGVEHMNKVVEQNILAPIADEVAAKAEVVLVGYAGGGVRNIFANKPLRTLADLKGLKVRVQGAQVGRRRSQPPASSPTRTTSAFAATSSAIGARIFCSTTLFMCSTPLNTMEHR